MAPQSQESFLSLPSIVTTQGAFDSPRARNTPSMTCLRLPVSYRHSRSLSPSKAEASNQTALAPPWQPLPVQLLSAFASSHRLAPPPQPVVARASLVAVDVVLASPIEPGRTPDSADLCNFGGALTTLWMLNISDTCTSATCTLARAPTNASLRGSAAYTDICLQPLDILMRDEGRATTFVA